MQIEIWLALGNESLSANDSFYFFSTRDRKLMASLQIQEQLHPEAADFRLFCAMRVILAAAALLVTYIDHILPPKHTSLDI